jgi:hypothetical protein
MSDRFEEAGQEFTEIDGARTCEFTWEKIARAFRWYHEKYLQEALTAAAMMKLHEEKGTCETCRYHEAHDKHMYRSLCGRLTWNTKDDFGCIEYSRRIEEVK